ncbi:response regulator [Glaciecola sp. SC05]|uniref:response regulator n=1 Tax=Glaciecola sp. SC05 TaxID=1987355 RepID=UPI0035293A4B
MKSIELVSEHVPDVVLMDLKFNTKIDGVEATRRIREVSPNTKVLVVASYRQDEYVKPHILGKSFIHKIFR